jgi:putative ABC transport system substrate-binding protein
MHHLLTHGEHMRLVEDSTMRHSAVGLIVIVALVILVAPRAIDAQPRGQVRRIGFLASGSRAIISASPRFEAFKQALRDLGWVEGQNLVIESRYAEGREERLPDLAADLVSLQVEVIVVVGGDQAVRAANHATSTIPIVGVIMGDPVGAGLVASLARPGGNLTGVSGTPPEIAGKRLELLKEAVPAVTHVAVLTNPANHPASASQLQATQVAAQALGVQLQVVEIRSPDAFANAFAAMIKAGADALFVLTDPLLFERHASTIAALALKHRLPAMYPWRIYTDAGGLMFYNLSMTDMYRRGATYVDKILKGAKPADLPVEQPMKFELVINLKTAKALGLTIPPTLLVLADEVMQ